MLGQDHWPVKQWGQFHCFCRFLYCGYSWEP